MESRSPQSRLCRAHARVCSFLQFSSPAPYGDLWLESLGSKSVLDVAWHSAWAPYVVVAKETIWHSDVRFLTVSRCLFGLMY